MSRASHIAAARGNHSLLRLLDDMAGEIDRLKDLTGSTKANDDGKTVSRLPGVPSISVSGVDGKYTITITPASNWGATYYQLQSSTTIQFDEDGSVETRGPSTSLHYEVQQPNETRYWRVRASYDKTTWTEWVWYSDPALCGPAPVWSGLERNSSLVINNAATTPSGANPLTQSGTTTTIAVAASSWTAGDQTLSYDPGTVDPGSYGTWLVYAKDPKRTGGTVVFYATADSDEVTASNDNIYFGKITTAGGGGGTGSGGGGGTCCRAGVPYRLHDGSAKDASEIAVGDVLMGADGGPEVVQRVLMHPARPCFQIEFSPDGTLAAKTYIGDFTVYQIELDRSHTFIAGADGVIDGAASTHTIQYRGGGFTDVFGAVVNEQFNIIGGGIGSHNYLKTA